MLILRLHQERLTELLQLANDFQQKLDKITNKSQKDRIANAGDPAPLGLGVLATISEEPGADIVVKSKYSLNNKDLHFNEYNVYRLE